MVRAAPPRARRCLARSDQQIEIERARGSAAIGVERGEQLDGGFVQPVQGHEHRICRVPRTVNGQAASAPRKKLTNCATNAASRCGKDTRRSNAPGQQRARHDFAQQVRLAGATRAQQIANASARLEQSSQARSLGRSAVGPPDARRVDPASPNASNTRSASSGRSRGCGSSKRSIKSARLGGTQLATRRNFCGRTPGGAADGQRPAQRPQ